MPISFGSVFYNPSNGVQQSQPFAIRSPDCNFLAVAKPSPIKPITNAERALIVGYFYGIMETINKNKVSRADANRSPYPSQS